MAKYVELDEPLSTGEKHCLLLTEKERYALAALTARTTHNAFGSAYTALKETTNFDLLRELYSTLDSINVKKLEDRLNEHFK